MPHTRKKQEENAGHDAMHDISSINKTGLQDNNRLLQSLLDSFPHHTSVYKSIRDNSGKIIDFELSAANQKARLNLPPDAIGKRYTGLFPGFAALGLLQRMITTVETGVAQNFQRHYTFDNNNRWFQISLTRFNDGVIQTTEDITVRKKAEQELKESKEALSASLPPEAMFLGTASAGKKDYRLAAAAAIFLLTAFAATAPFAARPLPVIPTFVPIYNAFVGVLDLITAFLLFAQFRQLKQHSFLVLACGYMYTPLIMAAHAVSFPNAFVPGSLIGGQQTTAWLWMAWHTLFPLFIAGYALLRRKEIITNPVNKREPASNKTIFMAVLATVVAAIGSVAITTWGEHLLPPLMVGSLYRSGTTKLVLTVGWVTHLVALALLVRSTRLRRLLDVWLSVTLVALLIDLALSALLIHGRFQVGFYMGRVYGLLAACFVLSVLLRETIAFYGKALKSSKVLRESEERKAFLLTLDDAIIPLQNTSQLLQTVCTLLGKFLNADRVHYTEHFEDKRIVIPKDFFREGLNSLAGNYRSEEFDEIYGDLRSGHTVVVNDTQEQGRFSELVSERYLRSATGSMVVVPLVREGRLTWTLHVISTTARLWTTEETSLIKEVAERTWNAVQRAKSEEALRQSEERLRLATEASDMYSWDLDLQTQKIQFSPNTEQVIGRPPLATFEENLQLIHPNDQKIVRQAFHKAMTDGSNYFDYEVRLIVSRNEIRWLRISGVITGNTENLPIRIIGIAQNITERKNIEQQLAQFNLQLEHQVAERTRELKENKDLLQGTNEQLRHTIRQLESFNYLASHDLQEPLRKIQTFVDLLQESKYDEQLLQEYSYKINESSRRMSQLLQSLLDYSRLSQPMQAFQNTDLNTVLENVITDYEITVTEKQAVIESEKLPTLVAIPFQMYQLFSNLIGNALKFCDKRPAISIRSKIVRADEMNIPNDLPATRRFAEIQVADNGIGFDNQYKDRIFQIFQRLHSRSKYGGTGIGLSIVEKIIQNHNGYITANGQKNAGATFTVYLPVD
jgi:PAS domain S-box-containing protein